MSDDVIVRNPDICSGKPVFRGTRITVQTIFEFLAAGDSIESVLDAYPRLKRSDIEAAFAYASRMASNEFEVALVS